MIAIVPARGGSKGLPGKNVKKLNGKPLILYTIEAALRSSSITEVIVSTDDKEIYNTAVIGGAKETFLRPAELATDDALAIDNYIYTIDRLKNEFKMDCESFVVLQPTSPLRTADDIDNAVNLYRNSNAASVISYTEEAHPVTWHKYVNEDGSLESIFQDKLENRQKYRPTYYPNGAVYVFSRNLIMTRKYFDESTKAYLMPRDRSVDIDTIDDFLYAQFLMDRKANA